MTNEIKEILDEMKEVAEYSTASNLVRELDSKDCKLLLDYITNLQEEKNMYKGSFETMSKNYFEEKQRIDKTLDMIDLIIPELWNINNNMTYKLQDVRRTLRGDE